MAACIHHIQSWCASMRLKLNATKTELIWFDRRSRVDDNPTKNLNLDPQCSIPPSGVVRDLSVLLDCRLNMTQHVSTTARTCFFHLRRIRQVRRCLDETYSCSSSRHLPTRLLQLCPLWSAFIHTATLVLGTTHCCSSNKRSKSQRPHHTYTETTALASHPGPYCIQNLPPPVSHPFWTLSIIHVIHGYASRSRGLRSSTRGDFAVIRTNLKFGNRAFSVAGPREGTAFLFQFVNAHLLPNLSQN